AGADAGWTGGIRSIQWLAFGEAGWTEEGPDLRDSNEHRAGHVIRTGCPGRHGGVPPVEAADRKRLPGIFPDLGPHEVGKPANAAEHQKVVRWAEVFAAGTASATR